MKKLLLLILFISPLSLYAQFSDLGIGMDVGFTSNKFINMDASISKGLWYYGLSIQMNVSTGEKGKSYDGIIDWDNDLDGISDTGDFYAGSYGFDLGYYFKENFCLGGGFGYANFKKYRNFHDNTEILSESGWYHVAKGDGGKLDAKAFIHYYFKKGLLGRCYLRGQYSLIGGVGASIGWKFGS